MLALWHTLHGTLPPDEGVELADVDSLRDGRSMSRHSASEHASMPSEGGRRAPLTDSVVPEASPFASTALRIDDTSALHPFSLHKSDARPIWLMTIAHAFNYRMAVLRDGVKSAVRVGRSRKAEGCFLSNSDCVYYGVGIAVFSGRIGRLEGLVPFVSDRPGAYGRLLLTVYVRWWTGLLVSSDWL